MCFTLTPRTDENYENPDAASAVVVDWLGAGRVASGERWAFDEYRSRFEFLWEEASDRSSIEGFRGSGSPRLVEALRLRRDDCKLLDNPLQAFDAFVTIFACGPQAESVVRRIKTVALLLAARAGARVRSEASCEDPGITLPQLKGRAVMGVTRDERSGCTVTRLMAEYTEDVYRLLHTCLAPLASRLGAEPYGDRVHGAGVFQIVQSDTRPSSDMADARKPKKAKALVVSEESVSPAPASSSSLDFQQQFTLCHLTDSMLPVGGFAHSGGIEAALQLGLLSNQEGDIDGLRNFIKMLALSTFRLQGQFARSAYKLGAKDDASDLSTSMAWRTLDADLHAHLVGGLACRASQLQGAGLGRIGRRWCEPSLPKNGHFASLFGLLCARPWTKSLY